MNNITDPEQIASLIQSVRFWYHQIELAPGIITPGKNASSKVLENLDSLGLPKDAKGLRVLDIGCRDGYFAFELGLQLQKADLCTKAVRNYFFAYKRGSHINEEASVYAPSSRRLLSLLSSVF